MNARGIDQHTLMSDTEHQKEMRKQKHTSGSYQFKTDGGKVDYESQLDKNFLMFCDRVVELPSYAVLEAPESFPYFDPKENVQRQYTPDYYLPDYNLLIEIKEGGNHPNTNPAYLKETKYKVALKDEAMKKQTKYNFIRISGANYGPFLEMLYNITHQQVDDEKPKKALVVITESACVDPDEQYDISLNMETEEVNPDNVRLFIGYMEGGKNPQFVGITDSGGMFSWFIHDYESGGTSQVPITDPIFDECASYALYKYVGEASPIQEVFHRIPQYLDKGINEAPDLVQLMAADSVTFDDGGILTNNHSRQSDFIKIEEGKRHVTDI